MKMCTTASSASPVPWCGHPIGGEERYGYTLGWIKDAASTSPTCSSCVTWESCESCSLIWQCVPLNIIMLVTLLC